VIKKAVIYIILTLATGLVVGSYAGGEKSAPETLTLGSLAKTYEPVMFSHAMHSLIAEDCAVCHHHSPAGQTPACSKCHQASADSKDSNIPALKDAYHRQCIDCHKQIEMGPTGCMECHAKRTTQTSSIAPIKKQIKEASKDRPEIVTLSSLERRYEPVIFSHAMHTEMAENCAACHHHSPSGQTPACRECHGEPFNPKNLNMPGIKGAYHLQCMGCHQEISGPVGCTECHAKKASPTSGLDKK
jgi:hypothetical protein